MDGSHRKLVNIVSGVPQSSVLGPLWFLLNSSEIFSILENKLISHAEGYDLSSFVPSPGVRVTIAESLNRDPCNDS